MPIPDCARGPGRTAAPVWSTRLFAAAVTAARPAVVRVPEDAVVSITHCAVAADAAGALRRAAAQLCIQLRPEEPRPVCTLSPDSLSSPLQLQLTGEVVLSLRALCTDTASPAPAPPRVALHVSGYWAQNDFRIFDSDSDDSMGSAADSEQLTDTVADG
eukprot:TRINITY_DN35984_c0_g1_i1.p2 TRINITY_DN35984_c0_g1~~TRINITY_DN35984_c0_g1_i1.p2  ORF type:complete len:186 (+),score=56.04 TRINITY_DN35984_c0_g1_i1:83-559(+)